MQHRRGQRPGQRARHARCARRSARSTRTWRDIELVNFKVRILDEDKGTGAVTRVLLDASDGTERVGLDRRLRERRRGLLAGARRLARARHARPGRRRERPAGDPARAAGARRGRGAARARRCCAPGGSRSGRCSASSSERFAAVVGAPLRERRLERHRRAAPGAARRRRARRRRGHHQPVLVRRVGQRDRLRARAAGLRRHRPAHADDRPGGRRGGRDRAHDARCCRCTSSAGPPTSPALERLGLPIVEDACEALGARYADGVAVGARGHPAVFAFYANKQMTTGEGGMVTLADAALKERIDSERNQGRAPDMDWLDHDRLGFNYRLSEIAVRDRPRPARAPRRDARGARARRRRLRRGARAGSRASSCSCPDEGGSVRGWFVYTVGAAARRRPRRDDPRRCASAACRASPTCRRST